MPSNESMSAHRRIAPGTALFLGALAVGVLDILDAFLFFGARGVAPIRILQSIASGLLGPAAFRGGWSTAALGAGLHLLIASVVVLVFFVAARRFEALVRRPFLFGPLYGLGVYGVMNLLVLPLSAANAAPRPAAVVVNGVLIHLVGVGIPAALAARAAVTSLGAGRHS